MFRAVPHSGCRRPGDENLKPNQKLNAMLQRILKADYTFPPDKPLRWGARAAEGTGARRLEHHAMQATQQCSWRLHHPPAQAPCACRARAGATRLSGGVPAACPCLQQGGEGPHQSHPGAQPRQPAQHQGKPAPPCGQHCCTLARALHAHTRVHAMVCALLPSHPGANRPWLLPCRRSSPTPGTWRG